MYNINFMHNIQIIVATPARLNDIIANHPSDIDLGDIEALVLDEVDCLLQMGFEPQVAMSLSCSLIPYSTLFIVTTIDSCAVSADL